MQIKQEQREHQHDAVAGTMKRYHERHDSKKDTAQLHIRVTPCFASAGSLRREWFVCRLVSWPHLYIAAWRVAMHEPTTCKAWAHC